jgi:hypothetical protein
MTRARRFGLLRIPWLLGVILLVLTGCGDKGGDGSARRTSRLTLQVVTADQPSSTSLRRAESSGQTRVAPGSPGFVTRLDIRIEAADIASPITRSLTLTEAQQSEVTVELLVPVGTQRRILVTAFNASGAKIFEGETTVDLTRDLEVVTLTLVRVLLLEAADAADLANKTFAFADGVALGVVGAVTLTFGTFVENTGPFTLTSDSRTASGTVTIVPATTSSTQSRATSDARCDFLVATSTYPPDQGPQAGEQSPVFCQVDAVDGRLTVADVETGARSLSTPPVVAVGGTFPFLLDFSRLDDASQRLQ